MKRIRYTKYVPDPAGEMSLEDLLGALSDYLLQSGFQDYLSYYDLPNGEQTLDDLKRAIERALLETTLRECKWNKTRAAEQLGVTPKTLLAKLRTAGLEE